MDYSRDFAVNLDRTWVGYSHKGRSRKPYEISGIRVYTYSIFLQKKTLIVAFLCSSTNIYHSSTNS